jgi:hypothetical protein
MLIDNERSFVTNDNLGMSFEFPTVISQVMVFFLIFGAKRNLRKFEISYPDTPCIAYVGVAVTSYREIAG